MDPPTRKTFAIGHSADSSESSDGPGSPEVLDDDLDEEVMGGGQADEPLQNSDHGDGHDAFGNGAEMQAAGHIAPIMAPSPAPPASPGLDSTPTPLGTNLDGHLAPLAAVSGTPVDLAAAAGASSPTAVLGAPGFNLLLGYQPEEGLGAAALHGLTTPASMGAAAGAAAIVGPVAPHAEGVTPNPQPGAQYAPPGDDVDMADAGELVGAGGEGEPAPAAPPLPAAQPVPPPAAQPAAQPVAQFKRQRLKAAARTTKPMRDFLVAQQPQHAPAAAQQQQHAPAAAQQPQHGAAAQHAAAIPVPPEAAVASPPPAHPEAMEVETAVEGAEQAPAEDVASDDDDDPPALTDDEGDDGEGERSEATTAAGAAALAAAVAAAAHRAAVLAILDAHPGTAAADVRHAAYAAARAAALEVSLTAAADDDAVSAAVDAAIELAIPQKFRIQVDSSVESFFQARQSAETAQAAEAGCSTALLQVHTAQDDLRRLLGRCDSARNAGQKAQVAADIVAFLTRALGAATAKAILPEGVKGPTLVVAGHCGGMSPRTRSYGSVIHGLLDAVAKKGGLDLSCPNANGLTWHLSAPGGIHVMSVIVVNAVPCPESMVRPGDEGVHPPPAADEVHPAPLIFGKTAADGREASRLIFDLVLRYTTLKGAQITSIATTCESAYVAVTNGDRRNPFPHAAALGEPVKVAPLAARFSYVRDQHPLILAYPASFAFQKRVPSGGARVVGSMLTEMLATQGTRASAQLAMTSDLCDGMVQSAYRGAAASHFVSSLAAAAAAAAGQSPPTPAYLEDLYTVAYEALDEESAASFQRCERRLLRVDGILAMGKLPSVLQYLTMAIRGAPGAVIVGPDPAARSKRSLERVALAGGLNGPQAVDAWLRHLAFILEEIRKMGTSSRIATYDFLASRVVAEEHRLIELWIAAGLLQAPGGAPDGGGGGPAAGGPAGGGGGPPGGAAVGGNAGDAVPPLPEVLTVEKARGVAALAGHIPILGHDGEIFPVSESLGKIVAQVDGVGVEVTGLTRVLVFDEGVVTVCVEQRSDTAKGTAGIGATNLLQADFEATLGTPFLRSSSATLATGGLMRMTWEPLSSLMLHDLRTVCPGVGSTELVEGSIAYQVGHLAAAVATPALQALVRQADRMKVTVGVSAVAALLLGDGIGARGSIAVSDVGLEGAKAALAWLTEVFGDNVEVEASNGNTRVDREGKLRTYYELYVYRTGAVPAGRHKNLLLDLFLSMRLIDAQGNRVADKETIRQISHGPQEAKVAFTAAFVATDGTVQHRHCKVLQSPLHWWRGGQGRQAEHQSFLEGLQDVSRNAGGGCQMRYEAGDHNGSVSLSVFGERLGHLVRKYTGGNKKYKGVAQRPVVFSQCHKLHAVDRRPRMHNGVAYLANGVPYRVAYRLEGPGLGYVLTADGYALGTAVQAAGTVPSFADISPAHEHLQREYTAYYDGVRAARAAAGPVVHGPVALHPDRDGSNLEDLLAAQGIVGNGDDGAAGVRRTRLVRWGPGAAGRAVFDAAFTEGSDWKLTNLISKRVVPLSMFPILLRMRLSNGLLGIDVARAIVAGFEGNLLQMATKRAECQGEQGTIWRAQTPGGEVELRFKENANSAGDPDRLYVPHPDLAVQMFDLFADPYIGGLVGSALLLAAVREVGGDAAREVEARLVGYTPHREKPWYGALDLLLKPREKIFVGDARHANSANKAPAARELTVQQIRSARLQAPAALAEDDELSDAED